MRRTSRGCECKDNDIPDGRKSTEAVISFDHGTKVYKVAPNGPFEELLSDVEIGFIKESGLGNDRSLFRMLCEFQR